MKVGIDSHAGFCGGVIKAIDTAEKNLNDTGEGLLFSLGDIVHNEKESLRLKRMGLQPKTLEELLSMENAGEKTVLIRAHGIAPSVRASLEQHGFTIIDCTCPVVLSIQKQIREAKGKVLIFGKHGHPEVLGLVGQKEDAEVFDSLEQLRDILDRIPPSTPLEVFSQTTMSPDGYAEAGKYVSESMPHSIVHDTICRQVASRHRELSEFASSHDIVVFVAGSHSSNGKVLCSLCKSVNPRTYAVGGPGDIMPAWFDGADSVGVSGATSTPRWLLEEVARTIENLQ